MNDDRAFNESEKDKLLNEAKEQLKKTMLVTEKHLTTIDNLRFKLYEVGICPDCLEERTHLHSEPFSVCRCGTSEDAGGVPTLQKLRAAVELARNHPFVPSSLVQQINETIK